MSASESAAPVAALLVAAVLGYGCTAERDLWPIEKLDPRTAVTTTIMVEPWVYSRDVPALAANARDYLHVGVAETNRTGQRAYWLGVVAWSTLDRSALPAAGPRPRPDHLRFVWADDALDLNAVPGGRGAVGSTEPIFAAPQPAYQDSWFTLTPAQLASLAAAPPTRIDLLRDDGTVAAYAPWRVNPAVLAALLEATGFAGPATSR